ncbi:MAG TPA: sensor histidine kinase [Dinghuibacter sp.]|uniref:sensor histidine kinase n=1 Tax=Dinghuibacter sp. TaxID=2024697 RepID=UPI002C233F68|nr:sensor histidine kinase [Dinghuibacter sp.]HTJ14648.1 sensor histidine kinase [Dinghuibacter sp.]
MNLVDAIQYCHKKYRLAGHVVFWGVILVVSIFSTRYYDGSKFTLRQAFIGNGVYMIPQMVGAYWLTYMIVPLFFVRKRYVTATIAFVLGSYLVCVMARFLVVRVTEPLTGVPPKAFETNWEIISNLGKLTYVYYYQIFCLAFLYLFVHILLEQLVIQQRALTLERDKMATELKLLKSQLNPHFLFNTLNNIYALSLAGSSATSSSIAKLSEILDYILYRCNAPLVPLAGEIGLLNDYLSLEGLRYSHRLEVRFEQRLEQDASVPPLLLLSLAENAFKHGASQDLGSPRIDIALAVAGDRLRYCVSNTVAHGAASAAPTPGAPAARNGRIGLSNIQKQLEILFPNRHTFTTGFQGDRFEALVLLDLKKAPHAYPLPAR